MNKKLYRSPRQQVIAGVCGGLAEFFGIDVVIVRLIWAVSIFIAGTGLLLYIIAALIIPKGEYPNDTIVVDEDGNETVIHGGGDYSHTPSKNNTTLFIGAVLLLLGVFSLMNRFVPFRLFWHEIKDFGWPAILIIIGIFVIGSSIKNKQ